MIHVAPTPTIEIIRKTTIQLYGFAIMGQLIGSFSRKSLIGGRFLVSLHLAHNVENGSECHRSKR
jgi:hypothetical protein